MRRVTLLLPFCASIAVLGSACSKKPAAAKAPSPVTTAESDRARRDADERASAERIAAEERAKTEREQALAARAVTLQTLTAPIYFELDKSDLTEEGRRALDAKLELLQRATQIRIRIEGNADDSGSDEYNMALGERRAAVASRYLIQEGISASRIQIVSRGEEKPACTDRDEPCRAKNRRDEFMVTSGL